MKANACIAVFLAALIALAAIRASESLSERQIVRDVLAENSMLKAAAKWATINGAEQPRFFGIGWSFDLCLITRERSRAPVPSSAGIVEWEAFG